MGIFNNELKQLDIITRKKIIETITIFHDAHHHNYLLSSIENAVLITDIYKKEVTVELKMIYPKLTDFNTTSGITSQIHVYPNTNKTSIPIQSYKLYYNPELGIENTSIILEKIGGKLNFIRNFNKYLLTIAIYINLASREYRTYVLILHYDNVNGLKYQIKKSVNVNNGLNIFSIEFDGSSGEYHLKTITLMFHNAVSTAILPMANFSTIIFSILFICISVVT